MKPQEYGAEYLSGLEGEDSGRKAGSNAIQDPTCPSWCYRDVLNRCVC